ncbi:flagellar biosynthetic protein FliO [Butyrivibrio proteoclasticus]|uniref:flagellar biosynthetic protein FliO n=1 Tax=Butyrivibrio proteoclasticus TaxID=43305 RepID=UPI00047CBB41|nr:flagellar biosynthetic protein FliO [Butyrivibrio proteoclasticus]
MGIDSYLQLVSVLIIFVLVLLATYYVSKWIANYQRGTVSSGNIELIETCRISTTNYVQIVRVGQKYIAIAVSKDSITNLGEVSKEDLVFKDEEAKTVTFKEIFEKIKSEKKK